MANLQVKNVPAGLYRKIQRQAKRNGTTLRDLVLDAVRREIARAEFQERLARREPVDLARPAARSLEEIRAERDREIDS
jgi:hypothetical protein